MPAPRAVRASSGRAASSGVSKRPGAIGDDADAARGHVAGGRQGHADDAALGGGVGDLADLAVVGGDRGGVDADAALALAVGLVLAHRRGSEAQHVEGPDQVDLDHVGEELEVVGTAFVRDPLGPADPGAADRDPQTIVVRWRPARPQLTTAASSVTSACTKVAPGPSSAASASPFSALRSAIVTAAPAATSARAVASPSPEAPPATNALVPATSTAAHPTHTLFIPR